MSQIDDLIAEMERIVAEMEYVEDGDYVLSKHTNLFMDYLSNAVQAVKQLYDRFKSKTGKTIKEVEDWIYMAESRFEMIRKVKFGDVVLTKDHNLVIDILKPIELSLEKMEENL